MKRHLFVCTGPTCSQAGAEETLQRLHELLGGQPIQMTLCRCLGRCGDGPNMVVYPDGVWYSGVDSEAAERIVRDDLLPGYPIPPRAQPADR